MESWPESRQIECASVTWRAFSIPGSFVGKQGDSRGEREIGEATQADFFRTVHPFFGLFCLIFSSFFLFSRIKRCPNNFIYVFPSDDGYQTIIYNRDLNITEPDHKRKNTCFSKIYISKILLLYYCLQFFLSAFFYPHFSIRVRHPHPSSAGIRSAFYRHPDGRGKKTANLNVWQVRQTSPSFKWIFFFVKDWKKINVKWR